MAFVSYRAKILKIGMATVHFGAEADATVSPQSSRSSYIENAEKPVAKGDVVSGKAEGGLRPLRVEEDLLVRGLLEQVEAKGELRQQLDGALVCDIADGGMGSFEFAGDKNRTLGRCLIEAEFMDRDSVQVSIVLNADQNGRLYELDMWKVDFTPLQEYPVLGRLKIKI